MTGLALCGFTVYIRFSTCLYSAFCFLLNYRGKFASGTANIFVSMLILKLDKNCKRMSNWRHNDFVQSVQRLTRIMNVIHAASWEMKNRERERKKSSDIDYSNKVISCTINKHRHRVCFVWMLRNNIHTAFVRPFKNIIFFFAHFAH